MDSEILQLASDANEAVTAFREHSQISPSRLSYNVHNIIKFADELAEAVDRLTGAIVEEANR